MHNDYVEPFALVPNLTRVLAERAHVPKEVDSEVEDVHRLLVLEGEANDGVASAFVFLNEHPFTSKLGVPLFLHLLVLYEPHCARPTYDDGGINTCLKQTWYCLLRELI